MDVSPYALPIFIPKKKITTTLRELTTNNIECQKVNFDVNRCLLNPKFKECLLISFSFLENKNNSTFEKVVDIIKKNCI